MLDRGASEAGGSDCRVWHGYDSPMALTPITSELIDEAARRLARAAPDAEIVLFGSHARGDSHLHSDVDFLVIEPQVANGAEESVRLRRELRGLPVAFDIIVVSRSYAERRRHVYGNVVNAALSEGKILAS